jgi:hypothetical protein
VRRQRLRGWTTQEMDEKGTKNSPKCKLGL